MNEFKGTPGKWIQSHRLIPNDEDGMYSTQVHTEDGETIATVHWYPKPKEKGFHEGKPVLITGTYRESNALLISKAPEMLEMLKSSLDTIKWYMENSIPDDNHEDFFNIGMNQREQLEQLIQEATTV